MPECPTHTREDCQECYEDAIFEKPEPTSWREDRWRHKAEAAEQRVAELESEVALYRAALERIINHKVKAGGHIVRIAEDALKGEHRPTQQIDPKLGSEAPDPSSLGPKGEQHGR